MHIGKSEAFRLLMSFILLTRTNVSPNSGAEFDIL